MTSPQLLDAAGRRRSPATMPDFHRGRPPRNKGLQYPADPPTVEEIVAVMRCAGDRPYGLRTRALIVLLWRSGLRITEALSLARQLGHANLGITSIYLQGIDSSEIIDTVDRRPAPMLPASAGLR